MLLKIKHIIKFFLFYLSGLAVFPSRRIPEKSMLLIRLDNIGDYLLFRNYLPAIKQSQKYTGYHLTMLGNVAWKELAETLDADFIDRFIWIDVHAFNRNCYYRARMMRAISTQGYEYVISPVYSRDYYSADWITHMLNAREKIGSMGDLSNIPLWQKKISDRYFTALFRAKKETLFEFYYNRDFFEWFLSTKVEIAKPFLPVHSLSETKGLPEKYAILFIGASKDYKRWPVSNFAHTGDYIRETYHLPVILCGGHGDIDDAAKVQEASSGPVINLTGQTSLLELMQLIRGAELMVSNETSAPHFAVAIDTPCVVLYNGLHFGRFVPYPEEMQAKYVLVTPHARNNHVGESINVGDGKPNTEVHAMGKIIVKDVLAAVDSLLKESA